MKRQSAKQDVVFEAIVKKLKAEFRLSRLYLFGSRGRGEAQRDSDYDIVAVIPSSKLTRFKREVDARVALKDVPAAIDIFVYTEKEFEQDQKEFGSIAETATFEGREIHLDDF